MLQALWLLLHFSHYFATFREVKQRDKTMTTAPTTIRLIKVGDYLEAYEQDAKTLARELNLILLNSESKPMVFFVDDLFQWEKDKLSASGYRLEIQNQSA